MKVFDRFKGYGFVHHRALNNVGELRQASTLMTKHPERTHIFEGDICWDFSEGSEAFYFRHPEYVLDTLSSRQIRDGLRQEKLVGLDKLLDLKPTNAFLVIELKVGRGRKERALEKLVAFLEQHFAQRYWIDGFSLSMLDHIKQRHPDTPVTLHTEFVSGGRVLIGAPEWPPLRLKRISDLTSIDGIAIRRHGSESFMAKACADVRGAGKVLLVSRLHSLRHFECSKAWGAKAGYIHGDFEQLLALNDRLDRRVREIPAAMA